MYLLALAGIVSPVLFLWVAKKLVIQQILFPVGNHTSVSTSFQFKGKANLKKCVLTFEWNVDRDNELRVSGGREFQSHTLTKQLQRRLFIITPEMFRHMRWKELMNQMSCEQSEMGKKHDCKDVKVPTISRNSTTSWKCPGMSWKMSWKISKNVINFSNSNAEF